MKLSEICKILNPTTKLENDIEIAWLLTDSRNLTFPAGSLFFALKTKRNDGHKYIEELYHQNVKQFVISEEIDSSSMPEAQFIKVDNTLQALQKLTAAHRAKFDIPIIGITGSHGKTVMKEWMYQLLSSDYRIVRSPRNYNSQIGVPLSVWALSETTQLAVFEAGISEVGEMEKLQSIIQPSIGIFTNLDSNHKKGFSDLAQKAKEKLKLFENADVIIYNSDDAFLNDVIQTSKLAHKAFDWGKSDDAVVKIESRVVQDFSEIELLYQDEKMSFDLAFTDTNLVNNAIHAICTLLYLGFDRAKIAAKLNDLEAIDIRLEVKEGVNHSLIIRDTYNSDLNSLSIALNFLDQQVSKENLRKTVVLSDIFQTEIDQDELYTKVSDLILSKKIDRFIGVGSNICEFKHHFEKLDNLFFHTVEQLLQSEWIENIKDEIILLKATPYFQFDKIEAQIEHRVNKTRLEVNLNSIVKNLNYFRSKLNRKTKVMCMVKAFGYGSGSVEIAKILQHNRCDYLAVALADEGSELRKSGIKIPIVVMNPKETAWNTIIQNHLEPEIYSFKLLNSFIEELDRQAITDYPIHIKLDTGMHRLGFEEQDLPKLIEWLSIKNQVKISSIFSHLAGSDDAEFDDFTKLQISRFRAWSEQISKAFQHKILKHILNSAGTERFPQEQMDMVRLGIGLYNITALPQVKLENVGTLRSVILQIKELEEGESVGYSRRTYLKRKSKIGVVAIGYGDGYNRKLSNGVGELWINGQYVPVVGNISMDTLMVDLTGVEAKEGDDIEVFGEHITVESIAEKLDTIAYEVLTSISQRVKRVYYVD